MNSFRRKSHEHLNVLYSHMVNLLLPELAMSPVPDVASDHRSTAVTERTVIRRDRIAGIAGLPAVVNALAAIFVVPSFGCHSRTSPSRDPETAHLSSVDVANALIAPCANVQI